MAKKDPAFLFYSDKFIAGVQTMNFEDRGKYITLLALMHQQGRLDYETICFLVGSVSVKLKSKFIIDENGFWYNETLEDEVDKRRKYSESRSENGSKGGRPRKEDKPYGLIYEKHMGNHTINKDISLIKSNKEGICQKMIYSFKNVFPEYYSDSNVDLPATLKIAQHIAKQKGWPESTITNGRMNDIILEWESIIEFTKDHSLYSSFAIQDLEKKWTGVIQAKSSIKAKTAKSKFDKNDFI